MSARARTRAGRVGADRAVRARCSPRSPRRSQDDSGASRRRVGVEGPRVARSRERCGRRRCRGDFALRNQDGELVRLADLRGKVVVLTPTYTTCEESCPLAAQQIRGALDDLSAASASGSGRSRSASTPPTTRPTARRSSCSPGGCAATSTTCSGPARELQPVWREYGFAPQTEDAGAQLLRRAARQARAASASGSRSTSSRRRRSRTTSSCCCDEPGRVTGSPGAVVILTCQR